MQRSTTNPWLRVGLAALAAAHGAIWWRALSWWPQLPEQIPMHFNAAGEPDRWAERSAGAWFLTPIIMVALCVLFGAIARWIDRLAVNAPGMLNIPRKELFLRLSPAARCEVVLPTRTMLIWVLVGVNLLGLTIVEGMGRVAVVGEATISILPVVGFVAFAGALCVVSIRATTRAVERLAEAEGLA
ncbi:MAG: hypothetical protein RLY21_939 [Planctomycetota bacterium]|jgi:hypothetical protein